MKNATLINSIAADVYCPAEALINLWERFEVVTVTVEDGKLKSEFECEDGDEIIAIDTEFVNCNGYDIQPKRMSFFGASDEEAERIVKYLKRTLKEATIFVSHNDDGSFGRCHVVAEDVFGNKLEVEFEQMKEEEAKAKFFYHLKRALLARCSAIYDAPRYRINAINKTPGGIGHMIIACEYLINNF